MKKIFTLAVAMLFGLHATTKTVFAQNIVETGRPLIDLPLIMGGGNRTIEENIDRDLVVGGGQIKIISNIAGDAYVAGGQIEVEGNIEEDLIIGGGNVLITGNIGKNLIVAGGTVKVDREATVGGYILTAGGTIEINGTVDGSVKLYGKKMLVGDEAYIGGKVEADVEESMVSEKASIIGDKKINIHEFKSKQNEVDRAGKALSAGGSLLSFLGKLVTLLVLVTIFGKYLVVVKVTGKNVWSTMGKGLIVLATMPLAAVIMMITVVGFPLGLMTFGIYFWGIYLASLITAIVIGEAMKESKWVNTKNKYLLAIDGLLVITILGIIPMVGWIFKLGALLIGVGVLYRGVNKKTE